MAGLILKDLYNINNNIKSLLLMLIVMGLAIIPSGGIGTYIIASVFICSMIIITTVTYDSICNWDKFSLTTSISRKDIILSKYIVLFIFIAYGVIISSIISSVSWFFNKNIDINNIYIYVLLSIAISLLNGSVLIPLLFKYGAEKARILMYIVILIPVLLGGLLVGITNKFDIKFEMGIKSDLFIYLILIVICLIVVISIYFSFRIYRKKEF